ncbi:MAG TPA: glycosyltransferase family 9 protein [Pirellulales bacterium]|nr:glycosyltransferase family 9 protein [Pirellulales bacterium]
MNHPEQPLSVGDRPWAVQAATAFPGSVLLVKLGPLGEVVHTLPAAQAIREAFPDARIGWVVEQSSASLVRSQPWVDETIEWDRRHWGGLGKLIRRLRTGNWDAAVDFQGLLVSSLIAWFSGAPRRVGFIPSLEAGHWFYNERLPLESLEIHAVERHLALAAKLVGAAPAAPIDRPYLLRLPPTRDLHARTNFPMHPSADDLAAVEAWGQSRRFNPGREQLVILNPHGSLSANRWPVNHYVRLVQRLLERPQVRVALSGGVRARETCDDIAAPFGDAVWRADGRFSPLGMAALFSQASAVVAGDTGPLHLAAAVGAPVVALFGASSALRTGPYAANAIVLEAELACSPCGAKACPLKYDPPLCMQQIQVDRVLAAVLSRLAQARPAQPLRKSA